MMTAPKVINVLGTDIQIEFRKEEDDPKLNELCGYFDSSVNLIVVKIHEEDKFSIRDLEAHQRKTLRHEIIHAFLYESGLDWSSVQSEAWATNEEMVDWFAIQSPKIFKVFQELGVL